MKLYTFVVHYLLMCVKEYGCCQNFKRGDNSTYTFTKMGGNVLYLVSATPTKLLISSPGSKIQVNYCHYLASVVCKLFTFQASSPKPLGQLEPNFPGMFLGWSSTNVCFSFQSDIQHGCQCQ